MFELARLKVQGFRGFVGEQSFEFDQPVVILFGENHRGKSSTLNAVEWCLFGDDCVGKKTGIRERLGWEIANRYARRGGVAVWAEFKGPDGTYVVTRTASKTGKGASGTVTVTLPDGSELHGESGERRLHMLFRSSFRDFMTTVYQHQEAIRAILTDEPRERNDALDRLLGLSEYRELLKGIRGAEVQKAQKSMERDFEDLRGRAEQSVRTYDNLLREERGKAVAEGIREEDMTEQEALRRAKDIGEAVRSLAQDLEMVDLQVPVPQNYEEIGQFREWVKDQTDDLWAHAPDVARHEALAREQLGLGTLKGTYEAAKESETRAQRERDSFIQEHGDATALEKRAAGEQTKVTKLKEEIGRANDRANLVHEAIQYLKEVGGSRGTIRCPLCGAEAPDLLTHLETEWQDKIGKEVEELDGQQRQHISALEHLKSLRGRLEGLENDLETAHSEVETRVRQIASVLGRGVGKDDDPGALIRTRLGRIASELKRIGEAIEEKRKKISGIYDQLAKLRTVDEIINHERKRAVVERIFETKEFVELDELRDQAARLAEDVEAVRSSLAAASREEAHAKIEAAEAALDEYFCRIASHPTIGGLVMEVTEDKKSGLNSYAFMSKDGTDPTPILSQGDLNCLALSLFLGLARATGDTQPFGFLMLDDPAQSLGQEMKHRLVGVLESVASWRKLIVATPDDALRELLMANITKSKAVYNFVDWTEEGGPQVVRAA